MNPLMFIEIYLMIAAYNFTNSSIFLVVNLMIPTPNS